MGVFKGRIQKYLGGNLGQHGSLCNLHEIIHQNRVTKDVKVFNVGDEFLLRLQRPSYCCNYGGIEDGNQGYNHRSPSIITVVGG